MDSTGYGYLGCFRFATITSNAAIHIVAYVLLFTFSRILLEVEAAPGLADSSHGMTKEAMKSKQFRVLILKKKIMK